jgi:hypothetical protein
MCVLGDTASALAEPVHRPMRDTSHHGPIFLEDLRMQAIRNLFVAVCAALCFACSKKAEPVKAAPAPGNAPAAPAAVAPPPPSAAAAASVSAPAESPEVLAKRKAVDMALLEDSYKNDPLGQWATQAKASSTYASDANNPKAGYHPMRATGAPDVQRYGDTSEAWATKNPDAGIEWLELDYAKAVNATKLRIRQTHKPGAIIKVELFEADGQAHTVYQGPDNTVYEPNSIAWLNVEFEKTPYKTQRLKITLATNAVAGWNEIDAVQLIGE